jgi:hypothetical protein
VLKQAKFFVERERVTKKEKESKYQDLSILFSFFELACHVNFFHNFNQIVSRVSIFNSKLNGKDYFDTKMKG